MKVKVLDVKLQHIHYEGKIYKTGEVLNIKDKDFDPNKFVQVGKPPKKEEPEYTGGPPPELLKPQASEVPPSATETEVTIIAEEAKPKTRRRKT